MIVSDFLGDINRLGEDVERFWYGFEKKAMTNKKIFKRYIENLLSVMKKSSDPTDRAMHQYINKKGLGLEHKATAKVREIGEAPAINWAHNVHPENVKKMMEEARLNKHKPGWARYKILKMVGA